MSSEGSVSSNGSGIRQFGLYRTIDARTEEFLRSSRKRQIRQGCACAAISTAITVTVVVSVILVYEYSINSASNVSRKTSVKPNWIGLMNDSDITSISSKFNKKINFDRTTLKLLPILLKALNKNRYLEKILEEYSSAPPYLGTDSTEATFTRNIFSDSKNWLKLPTTRHYSTDYKTSPLMQWRTPTARLEYLTKIRKIRDYQRMLNYFDKMINEKVGIFPKKEFEYTESPFTAETIPMTKIDRYKNIQRLRNLPERKDGKDDPMQVCNCPQKLGMLLSKLIGALQDLIPHIIGNKIGLNIPCNKTKNEAVNELTTARTMRPTKRQINYIFSTTATSPTQKTTKTRPIVTLTSRKCCPTSTTTAGTTSKATSTTTRTTSSSTARTTTSKSRTTTKVTEATMTPDYNEMTNNVFEDNIIQAPTIKPLSLLNYQPFEETTPHYDLSTVPTEPPNTKTTKKVEVKYRTTEKIVPVKFITKESSTEKWLKPYNVDSFYSRGNGPNYKEDDYDEYFNNKPSKTINEFENLDVHSVESIKAKTRASLEDTRVGKGHKKLNFKGTSENVNPMNYHTVTMQEDVDLTSMRKLADMLYLPHENVAKVWKYTIEPDFEVSTPSLKKYKYPGGLKAKSLVTNSVEDSTTIEPDVEVSTPSLKKYKYPGGLKSKSIVTNSVEDSTTSVVVTNSIENSVDSTTSVIVTNSIETSIDPTTSSTNPSLIKYVHSDSAPYMKNDYYETTAKYHPNSLIQNEQQLIAENMGDDEFIEEFVRPTESTRNPYKYKNSTKNYENSKEDFTDLMKNEEEVINIPTKSMLPALRPIYLEIQRNNEWKQEEHADYDIYNFNNNVFDLPNINI